MKRNRGVERETRDKMKWQKKNQRERGKECKGDCSEIILYITFIGRGGLRCSEIMVVSSTVSVRITKHNIRGFYFTQDLTVRCKRTKVHANNQHARD